MLEVNQVKKISISNDDVANILEPKSETKTSFEYLKNNIKEFFLGYWDIFDSDLKEFFKYNASEEKKNIDYMLLSKEILTPSRNTISFCKSMVISIIFGLICCLKI